MNPTKPTRWWGSLCEACHHARKVPLPTDCALDVHHSKDDRVGLVLQGVKN
jgi:hypothetical protein